MQKRGKIAENILGKGALFNSQNDDGVPIFHGSAGTGIHLNRPSDFVAFAVLSPMCSVQLSFESTVL